MSSELAGSEAAADRRFQHSTLPLVTIGIPTYNRALSLERSLLSACAQSYANVEIIVSDNASSDGTKSLCERIEHSDRRVRYVRQPQNVGAEGNFAAVLDMARGECFMWLADDDWIDRDYIDRCVSRLLSDISLVLVSGCAKYYNGASFTHVGRLFQLTDDAATDRVSAYYFSVDDNALLYGVMRRKGLSLDARRIIGGDWYFVAGLAARGKIEMLADTYVHRSSGGASSDTATLSYHYGLTGRAARNPYGKIGREAARRIILGNSSFKRLPLLARVSLAANVYAIIYRRFYERLASRSSLTDRLITELHKGAFALARALRHRSLVGLDSKQTN